MLDKNNLAYVIGIAIGDGNLSNPNGRATRLRITCDLKFNKLIRNIISSIQKILPENKVSIVKRSEKCIDISCYSNKWEGFLGWKVGLGSKQEQKISIPKWIKNNRKFSLSCLKGLIETDGCVYLDRQYRMVNFVTTIPTLAKDVLEIMKTLGFNPNIQKFKQKNRKIKYTLRISRSTEKFIRLVNIRKE